MSNHHDGASTIQSLYSPHLDPQDYDFDFDSHSRMLVRRGGRSVGSSSRRSTRRSGTTCSVTPTCSGDTRCIVNCKCASCNSITIAVVIVGAVLIMLICFGLYYKYRVKPKRIRQRQISMMNSGTLVLAGNNGAAPNNEAVGFEQAKQEPTPGMNVDPNMAPGQFYPANNGFQGTNAPNMPAGQFYPANDGFQGPTVPNMPAGQFYPANNGFQGNIAPNMPAGQFYPPNNGFQGTAQGMPVMQSYPPNNGFTAWNPAPTQPVYGAQPEQPGIAAVQYPMQGPGVMNPNQVGFGPNQVGISPQPVYGNP